MENYIKIKRLNEHHGEEWDPAILDMTVNTFLDKLKEVSPEAYDKMESIITEVAPEIAGQKSDLSEEPTETEGEEEEEYLGTGEDEESTMDQVTGVDSGGDSMPTFSDFLTND